MVIHCTIRLNVCHNKLFLPNLWKYRYHVYWNLSWFSRKVITLIKETKDVYTRLLKKEKKKWGDQQDFAIHRSYFWPNELLMYLLSFLWNEILALIFNMVIYMQRLAIQFVEMHCTRMHISFLYILISIRVTIAFYL